VDTPETEGLCIIEEGTRFLSFCRINHFRHQFGHLHILDRHPRRVKDSKPVAGGQEAVRRVSGKEQLAQLDRWVSRVATCSPPFSAMFA